MKKYIVSLLIILSASITYAQSMFDKYEDNDEVTSVVITEDMFQLIKDIEPESAEAKEEISVLSELTGLKVFTTENQTVGQEIKQEALNYVNTKKMAELMRINDKDAKVKFYVVKSDKPHIAKELLMIITKEKQTVLLLVTGNVDLRKLSKLNSKIKIIDGSKIKIIDGKYFEKVEEEQKGK